MEKSESRVQQLRRDREVVEDIMIKKEIKTADHNVKQQVSGPVDTKKKGSLKNSLKMLWRKSWKNDRHVEASEIDEIFSSKFQPVKSSEPSVQQQKRGSEFSQKKGIKTKVDETDAVFNEEFQSTKSNEAKSNTQKKKASQNKPKKISLKVESKVQKKEIKPQGLSPDAMKSMLGGGGYILG